MQSWWLIYAIVGWGLAQWVVVLRSLPDPPPDPMSWVVTSLAGVVGALVGAAVVRHASDPMPGMAILGAIAGALVLLGVARTFLRSGAKSR